MAVATYLQVKKQLHLENDSEQGYIENEIIPGVQLDMEGYLGFPIDLTVFANVRQDGNGHRTLYVDNPKITAVSFVKINNLEIAPAPDSESPGFMFDELRIILTLSAERERFTVGLQNILLSYNSGFSTVPKDLNRAGVIQSAYEFLQSKDERAQVTSRTLGPAQNTAFITDDWAPKVLGILNRRRLVTRS